MLTIFYERRNMENVTISFVCPVEMRQWLDTEAGKNDRSVSSLLRLIVQNYWENNNINFSPRPEVGQLELPYEVTT